MEVNLDALGENLLTLKHAASGAKVMGIVKANAYGHGLIPCARTLESSGVDALGVAFVEEGIALRRAGIRLPVLVLGGIYGSQIDLFLRHDLEITAPSVSKLEAINEAAARLSIVAKVHLKIDTGMNRLGVRPSSAPLLIERALQCRFIEVKGIYSHFVASEDSDHSLTRSQLERFLEVTSWFEKHSVPCPTRHIANSGAILQHPESYLDMVRPGLSLYGLYPAAHLRPRLPLAPIGALKSTVVFFKVIEKGETVSYNATWKAPARTRIVTIPIGYGDGYPRALSNIGSVLIRGRRCPIAGRVCMDQLMADIGPEGTAYNGDEVVLIGKSGNEEVRADHFVELLGNCLYEVTTSINQRVPRRYLEKGKEFFE